MADKTEAPLPSLYAAADLAPESPTKRIDRLEVQIEKLTRLLQQATRGIGIDRPVAVVENPTPRQASPTEPSALAVADRTTEAFLAGFAKAEAVYIPQITALTRRAATAEADSEDADTAAYGRGSRLKRLFSESIAEQGENLVQMLMDKIEENPEGVANVIREAFKRKAPTDKV